MTRKGERVKVRIEKEEHEIGGTENKYEEGEIQIFQNTKNQEPKIKTRSKNKGGKSKSGKRKEKKKKED